MGHRNIPWWEFPFNTPDFTVSDVPILMFEIINDLKWKSIFTIATNNPMSPKRGQVFCWYFSRWEKGRQHCRAQTTPPLKSALNFLNITLNEWSAYVVFLTEWSAYAVFLNEWSAYVVFCWPSALSTARIRLAFGSTEAVAASHACTGPTSAGVLPTAEIWSA